ncbi:hypothetical protein EMIT07CA2_70184 [Brevibacillus sp. IT-7CA2]
MVVIDITCKQKFIRNKQRRLGYISFIHEILSAFIVYIRKKVGYPWSTLEASLFTSSCYVQ